LQRRRLKAKSFALKKTGGKRGGKSAVTRFYEEGEDFEAGRGGNCEKRKTREAREKEPEKQGGSTIKVLRIQDKKNLAHSPYVHERKIRGGGGVQLERGEILRKRSRVE